jgi:hypothetical protein
MERGGMALKLSPSILLYLSWVVKMDLAGPIDNPSGIVVGAR